MQILPDLVAKSLNLVTLYRCVVLDDQLNILPLSSHVKQIVEIQKVDKISEILKSIQEAGLTQVE